MTGLKKSSWLHLLLLVVLLFSEGLAQRRSPSSSRTIRRGSHRTTYRSRQGASRASTSRTRTQRYGAAGRLRGGECKDEPAAHEICAKVVKELGIQVCHVKIEQLRYKLERSCAKTCNYCGEPEMSCRRTRDCCWDRFTPRGRVSCPECKDHMHLCRRFKRFCNSGKEENKEFMELHCPVTCGKCRGSIGAIRKGRPVTMRDWNKL